MIRPLAIALLVCVTAGVASAQTVAAPEPPPKKSFEDTVSDLNLGYDNADIQYDSNTGEVLSATFDGNIQCLIEESKLTCHFLEFIDAKDDHGRLIVATASPTTSVIVIREAQNLLSFCGKFTHDLDKGITILETKPIIYRVYKERTTRMTADVFTIKDVPGKPLSFGSTGRGQTTPVLDPAKEKLAPYLRSQLIQHIAAMKILQAKKAIEDAKAKAAAGKGASKPAVKSAPTPVPTPVPPVITPVATPRARQLQIDE